MHSRPVLLEYHTFEGKDGDEVGGWGDGIRQFRRKHFRRRNIGRMEHWSNGTLVEWIIGRTEHWSNGTFV